MSVKIPDFVQDFMKGKPGWVATASRDGMPNVAVKGSLQILDAEHLLQDFLNSRPPSMS